MARRSITSRRRRPSDRQGVFADSARRQYRETRREELRHVFAQEGDEKKEEKVQPGGVSPTLKRRMGDDISDMFDEAGKELYNETVESLKDVLREQFERTIPELDQSLRDEGGKRWQRSAAEFYRPWINEMVEVIITQGMNEASGALEDVAASYASEHAAGPESEEADELLEVPVEETEEVEEIEGEEEPEPVEGEEEDEEGSSLELEELLAAEFPRKKVVRRKPRRREVRATPRRMGPDRRYDDDVEPSMAPLREVEDHRRRTHKSPGRQPWHQVEEENAIEIDDRAPRRRGGARQRSYHPRKTAQGSSVNIPDIVWDEIEHYISDSWRESVEPYVTIDGNHVSGDPEVIEHILDELGYISGQRCGNENYSAYENVEVIDAINGVLQEAGREPRMSGRDCEGYDEDMPVGKQIGWFDLDEGFVPL